MTLRTRLALATAASIVLAGVANAMPTPDYLTLATSGDLYEKKASQLVLHSSRNDRIRNFASMMIADHNRSTGLVAAAAQQSGFTPPRPMLTAEQAQMIEDLRRSHGIKRDMMYLTQQKAAHRIALAAQQAYAATGDRPALRDAATQIVYAVKQHIALLDTIPAM